MVKGLKERRVPIDGVGFQTHVDLNFLKSIKEFEKSLQRFASLGVIIDLTELDITLPLNPAAADFELQTKLYEAITRACIKQRACGDIIIWGLSDDKSWLAQNSPTLFGLKGINYVAKPAYSIVQKLLR
jgi:endo-1,4-beta-xylanase